LKALGIGVILMGYPYFMQNLIGLYAMGTVLTLFLVLSRD
jgi:hypothetical protein